MELVVVLSVLTVNHNKELTKKKTILLSPKINHLIILFSYIMKFISVSLCLLISVVVIPASVRAEDSVPVQAENTVSKTTFDEIEKVLFAPDLLVDIIDDEDEDGPLDEMIESLRADVEDNRNLYSYDYYGHGKGSKRYVFVFVACFYFHPRDRPSSNRTINSFLSILLDPQL